MTAMLLPVTELDMTSPTHQNPPTLYRWALGWILGQLRQDAGLSQEAFGGLLGLSQAGYRKLEKGLTTNFDLYWQGFDEVGKDIVAAIALARVLVRAVEAEELSKSRALSPGERDAIAEQLYSAFA